MEQKTVVLWIRNYAILSWSMGFVFVIVGLMATYSLLSGSMTDAMICLLIITVGILHGLVGWSLYSMNPWGRILATALASLYGLFGVWVVLAGSTTVPVHSKLTAALFLRALPVAVLEASPIFALSCFAIYLFGFQPEVKALFINQNTTPKKEIKT